MKEKTDYNNILTSFDHLNEEDKVGIMVELYYQLTCAQRDEFLCETENG